jgi:hypothetical protein
MDCSQLVLSVIKDDSIKKNLNPIVYYCIKLIYDPEFSNRSRLFCRCIKNFFDKMSKLLNLEKVCNNLSEKDLIDNNLVINTILNQSNNMNENNKDSSKVSEILNNFSSHDWSWYIETLLDCEKTYILESDEDYCLIYMLQKYVFESQDPILSELMRGYNLFFSSVELMFCLRLILHFPKIYYMKKEQKKLNTSYNDAIKDRVSKFMVAWVKVYPKKYEKNLFIQSLINDVVKITKEEQHPSIDFISLSLEEPILPAKYVGIIKLIREGPFSFDITEIARQLCIIDQKNFSSIPEKDYIDYIVKKEVPESFNKIYKRETHFKCYVLIFILLIKDLENQKRIIQNFIQLADTCKALNNYQSEYTIISVLSAMGLQRKLLLWKMLDKKYKEMFLQMESDFKDVDLNEKTFFDKLKTGTETSVPHINLIKNQINNFIITIKMSGERQKVSLCREYRDFYVKIIDLNRNKYSYFLVNPLNDFLSNGFWEICKTKEWGIRTNFDLSSYADENSDAEKMFDALVKYYQKSEI